MARTKNIKRLLPLDYAPVWTWDCVCPFRIEEGCVRVPHQRKSECLLESFIHSLSPSDNNKTLEERVDYLNNFPFVLGFGPQHAECALCNSKLQLEPRGYYYPGQIHKHLINTCFPKKLEEAMSIMSAYLGPLKSKEFALNFRYSKQSEVINSVPQTPRLANQCKAEKEAKSVLAPDRKILENTCDTTNITPQRILRS